MGSHHWRGEPISTSFLASTTMPEVPLGGSLSAGLAARRSLSSASAAPIMPVQRARPRACASSRVHANHVRPIVHGSVKRCCLGGGSTQPQITPLHQGPSANTAASTTCDLLSQRQAGPWAARSGGSRGHGPDQPLAQEKAGLTRRIVIQDTELPIAERQVETARLERVQPGRVATCRYRVCFGLCQ